MEALITNLLNASIFPYFSSSLSLPPNSTYLSTFQNLIDRYRSKIIENKLRSQANFGGSSRLRNRYLSPDIIHRHVPLRNTRFRCVDRLPFINFPGPYAIDALHTHTREKKRGHAQHGFYFPSMTNFHPIKCQMSGETEDSVEVNCCR